MQLVGIEALGAGTALARSHPIQSLLPGLEWTSGRENPIQYASEIICLRLQNPHNAPAVH